MGIRQEVDTMEPPSLMLTTSPSFDEEIGLTSPNKVEISDSKSGRSRKASERSTARTSSPSSPSSSRSRKRRNNNKSPTNHRRRENVVSPERVDPVMKLAMCGSDINDEIKMVLVDVQVSLRQIVSTVRTFGPEEKECVRATLKDMKSSVKNKVRQLAVCTSSSSSTQPPRETKVTFSL